MPRFVFLLLLISCVFAKPGWAQTLDLVKGGKGVKIVLSSEATSVERYAAEELQRAIKLMSGTELAILNSDTGIPEGEIVIGSVTSSKRIGKLPEVLNLGGPNEEQIAVRRLGNTLFLAGRTPRAALYATYTFLQDVLGVRWFWPGADGEYIPLRSNIRIDQLNISEAPDLAIRSLAITGAPYGDPDTDTWMARNRLNTVSHRPGSGDKENLKVRRDKGFLIRIAGHNIVLRDSVLKSHPEYLAEIDGKRQLYPRGASHLCWSNLRLQEEVARMVGGWWDESPYPEIIHFYPADQTRYCECVNCTALGDISTRWQRFSEALIRKVDVAHPGKRYWTYAYLQYKSPPRTLPAPFEFIGYTLYDASYRHLLSSGNPVNKLPLAELDEWMDKKVNLGIRGYEFIIFRPPMFVPMVSWISDQMKWIHNKGMTGYLSELPAYGDPREAAPENTYWMCNRMSLYAAARSMWSTSVSAKDIVADWTTKIYGPAADAMAAYYWDMENLWQQNPKKISVFTHPPVSHVDDFLPVPVFEKLYQYFQDALSMIRTLPADARNKIESEIILEKKLLDNWHTISMMKHGQAGYYKNDVVRIDQADLFTQLPAGGKGMRDEKGGAVTGMSVSMGWNDTGLLFRFNGNPQAPAASRPEDIEILIQPNPDKPVFYRFTINSSLKINAEETYDGKSFTRLDIRSRKPLADAANDQPRTVVSIPFDVLGIRPENERSLKMAVNIRKNGLPLAGWPQPAKNTAFFSDVILLDKPRSIPPESLVLLDGGGDSGPLSVDLQKKGWDVKKAGSGADLFRILSREKPSVILLRVTKAELLAIDSGNIGLSSALRNYMLQGGLVIVSSSLGIPVHKWFPEVPEVKLVVAGVSSVRKPSFVQPGKWLNSPNDLDRLLHSGLSPVSAFMPVGPGWETLASISLQDGTSAPFILRKAIGKGSLILTSSPMGYAGGYDMFGNRNSQNVVKLIENLKPRNL